MALVKILLELARTPEFPEGSSHHGYEFVAPLNEEGFIDPVEWRANRAACRVRRFWTGEDDEHGLLRHTGNGWRFDYDKASDTDDEPFFKLDRHRVEPGTYVSITEHDGMQRPFRVVWIAPL